jgi:hypothetical protein
MQPTAVGLAVKARCPDCGGAVSLFDFRDPGREFGYILNEGPHLFDGSRFSRVHWRLLRCSGCGRGGLAKFHETGSSAAVLESFYPRAIASAPLPSGVPEGIAREYREAELCASVAAWRAASALLRSTVEKTLKSNGYTKGTLEAKIDEAANDGIITAARRQRRTRTSVCSAMKLCMTSGEPSIRWRSSRPSITHNASSKISTMTARLLSSSSVPKSASRDWAAIDGGG